jgi:hypothetical protein
MTNTNTAGMEYEPDKKKRQFMKCTGPGCDAMIKVIGQRKFCPACAFDAMQIARRAHDRRRHAAKKETNK